jgi:hypothetical protein
LPHVVNCSLSTCKNDSKQSDDMHKLSAVALAERSAAFVSFQRQQASLPPTQNANLAPCSLSSAGHFSGNYAIYAANAATTATFTTLDCASSIIGEIAD